MLESEIDLTEFGGLQPAVSSSYFLDSCPFLGLKQSLGKMAGVLTTVSATYWVRPHASSEDWAMEEPLAVYNLHQGLTRSGENTEGVCVLQR